MNNDLISRSALKDHISELMLVYKGTDLDNAIINAIDNAQTIPLPDFKEGYKQAILDGKTNYSRPHGEWLHPYITGIACECSICHAQMPTYRFYFCPNCGADMRKEAEK